MSSDLLSIAKSGAAAARIALDVTSQNITNASTDGYVRRSVQTAEVSSTSAYGSVNDVSVSGVRVSGIVRNADAFRQSEVRRTGSAAASADAEVDGLTNVEDAVEQSGAYDAVVQFQGSLQQLVSDPTNTSLRASTVEAARTMSQTMNIASSSLDAAGQGLQVQATDGVNQVNLLASQLAKVNLNLARATDSSSDQSTLLDQRDSLLQQMSNYVDVSTTINSDNTVDVRLGGTTGPQIVSLGTATTFGMNTAADGTISFTLGGSAVTPTAGSLVGQANALSKLADIKTGLNTIASSIITTANAAQANGAALDGSSGTAMFSGTGAGDMTMTLTDGSQLATAPAGSAANSRDASNLTALQTALSANDPATATDGLIFNISSAVQGRTVTRDALDSIASNAATTLQSQAGVSLDNEAANLVRYQQAFQASGRIMQVAQDTFNSILAIR